jgi:uncharacterized protein with HEPN domain
VSRDRVRLLHIRDAIARIRSFVTTKEAFVSDARTQDAVIRNLEVIGEAVKSLGRETRERRPEIPWSTIGGMRDHLIHGYFNVDLNLVWDAIVRDLEPLAGVVEALIDEDKD